jgi:mannonate dehydratase
MNLTDKALLPGRRDFGKMALGSALGGVLAHPADSAARAPLPKLDPGIKISVQSPIDPTDDDLLFAQQLGTGWVNLEPRSTIEPTAENYIKWRDRYASAGLKVWNISNDRVHCMEEVTLNLPGRDAKIEEYKQFLRTTAKAGLHYVTYAHMGNGIWSSARETVRGSRGRALDMNSPERRGSWNKIWHEPLSHGRQFSEQEIWDNYTYFIKQVVPLAEELGIRIGIHPDDPPVPVLAGVPRCIFASFDGYKRALEIADSPNIGMCLCVGCWAEGGKLMGKDVFETIHYFAARKKLFKVHFRNVTAPLPHFVETFPDNGYMDMYKVMKTLRQVNFDGVIIADHVPPMVGGNRSGTAYCVAYMRALRDRANQEVKA